MKRRNKTFHANFLNATSVLDQKDYEEKYNLIKNSKSINTTKSGVNIQIVDADSVNVIPNQLFLLLETNGSYAVISKFQDLLLAEANLVEEQYNLELESLKIQNVEDVLPKLSNIDNQTIEDKFNDCKLNVDILKRTIELTRLEIEKT